MANRTRKDSYSDWDLIAGFKAGREAPYNAKPKDQSPSKEWMRGWTAGRLIAKEERGDEKVNDCDAD